MIDSQRGALSTKLAIIISYPTSASRIIVLLKAPLKYRKLDYNKNEKAQKITHMLAIFVDHGIMAHYTMIAKPMKTLELHYPMIQFLINCDNSFMVCGTLFKCVNHIIYY